MIIIIIIKGVMIVLPFLLHLFLYVLFFPSWQTQVHVTRLLETNFIFHDYLSIIEDHVVISNTILVNIIVAYPEVICNMLIFFSHRKTYTSSLSLRITTRRWWWYSWQSWWWWWRQWCCDDDEKMKRRREKVRRDSKNRREGSVWMMQKEM